MVDHKQEDIQLLCYQTYTQTLDPNSLPVCICLILLASYPPPPERSKLKLSNSTPYHLHHHPSQRKANFVIL